MSDGLDGRDVRGLIKRERPRSDVELVPHTTIGEAVPVDCKRPEDGFELLYQLLNGAFCAGYLEVVNVLTKQQYDVAGLVEDLELAVRGRRLQLAVLAGDLA